MIICDMHSHILWGVDDGADTLEESLALIREEFRQGTRKIVLTPHFRREKFETSRRICLDHFRRLQDIVDLSPDFPPDLRLYLGCEFHVNQEIGEALEQDPAYRMNGGDSVLVEFSSIHTKNDIKNYVHNLVLDGWRPVIAHIERYPACRDLSFADELVRMGARIQVNADAVLGIDGLSTRLYVRKLLRENLVSMIGSDTHNLKDRPPRLKECAGYLIRKIGQAGTKRLMYENAAAAFSLE